MRYFESKKSWIIKLLIVETNLDSWLYCLWTFSSERKLKMVKIIKAVKWWWQNFHWLLWMLNILSKIFWNLKSHKFSLANYKSHSKYNKRKKYTKTGKKELQSLFSFICFFIWMFTTSDHFEIISFKI